MEENLSARLKKLRTERGLKQREVARYIGVKESAISAYETNLRKPTYANLIRLAKYYGVTADYLLGIETRRKDLLADLTGWRRTFIYKVVELLLEQNSEKNE